MDDRKHSISPSNPCARFGSEGAGADIAAHALQPHRALAPDSITRFDSLATAPFRGLRKRANALQDEPANCTCSIKLQGVQRSAKSLHAKLRRPDMQDRIPNLHEIVREEVFGLRVCRDRIKTALGVST